MSDDDRIRPWDENPCYWQYRGRPVLLVGGSKGDNLFQIPDLERHLDEMVAVGANYIRNTMSDRDQGDARAFARRDDGLYDLNEWNGEYWRRFQNLLTLTAERNIIVQIEAWDRFDHSRDEWMTDPYRPGNNVNYTEEESGLAARYPLHPSSDVQPFFHTIPGMEEYQERYDVIRGYQEAFVDKLLSCSLPFGNVLYCMNNETSTDAAWGQYWMDYIRRRAESEGVDVWCTDMFDDFWRGEDSETVETVMSDPETYPFVDISQINSRNFGQRHWDRMRWMVTRAREQPRPVNNTKVYGSGYKGFGSGGPEDGVERLMRNLLGGCASARFHRPTSGNGLNARARNAIRAVRKLEELVKLWNVAPHMELLSERSDNEAYVAADPGASYVVYFPYGGSVKIDLSACAGPMALRWFGITPGKQIGGTKELENDIVDLAAPASGGWLAAITTA